MQIQSPEQKVREGRAFYASSNKLALTVANNFRLTFQNPASSGKILYVYGFTTINDTAVYAWATVLQNPTTGLPTASLSTINQNLSSSNTSVAVIKADVGSTAISGGTAMPSQEIAPGRVDDQSFLLVIPQNTTIGINLPYFIAANPSFKLFWWEE